MTPTTLCLEKYETSFWSQVAIVIPAYNEEELIEKTLRRIPPEVGIIYLVDDASTDQTSSRAEALPIPQLKILRQEKNQGVGAAILRGYEAALQQNIQWVVVMAGDNQMNPADLPLLLADHEDELPLYVKGNRLIHERYLQMPRHRRWGSRFLARLTGYCSGVSLDDAQCGYTAINRRALKLLNLKTTWKGYGYPNDILIQLAARNCTILERPVEPVYAEEKSGLRPYHFLLIVGVILRRILLERRGSRETNKRLAQES